MDKLFRILQAGFLLLAQASFFLIWVGVIVQVQAIACASCQGLQQTIFLAFGYSE